MGSVFIGFERLAIIINSYVIDFIAMVKYKMEALPSYPP